MSQEIELLKKSEYPSLFLSVKSILFAHQPQNQPVFPTQREPGIISSLSSENTNSSDADVVNS